MIRRALRRLGVIFGVHYAEMIEYRAEIALWAVATCFPLIMLGVWVQAGASGAFPLDDVQLARYFLAVYMIRQVTVIWAIHHFEFLVVSGRLSPMLRHPIDPVWRFVLMHLGEQWTRLPFAVAIMGVVLAIYPQALWGSDLQPGVWWPGWVNLVLGVAACYAAFAVRFLMQWCLAMGAFWYERIVAADAVIYLPYLFLSGMAFPMEVVPEGFREILLLTPFPYLVWFPASLFVGGDTPLTSDPTAIARSFLIMGAWFALFYVLSRWLWRRGLRHYSAMGA